MLAALRIAFEELHLLLTPQRERGLWPGFQKPRGARRVIRIPCSKLPLITYCLRWELKCKLRKKKGKYLLLLCVDVSWGKVY